MRQVAAKSGIVGRAMRGVAAILIGALGVVAIGAAGGCASHPSPSPTTRPDFSDVRRVAQGMVEDGLSRPWLDQFGRRETSRKPIVVVAPIRNKSDMILDDEVLTETVLREFLNSGRVDVLNADDDIVRRLRKSKADTEFTDPAFIKSLKTEANADFILTGSLVSMRDGPRSAGYQFSLTLVDTLTNQRVWIGIEDVIKRR